MNAQIVFPNGCVVTSVEELHVLFLNCYSEKSQHYLFCDLVQLEIEEQPAKQTRQEFLYNYLLPRVKKVLGYQPKATAEDVTTDMIFHQGGNLRKLRQYEPTGSLNAWLYCVTRRIMLDYSRKEKNLEAWDKPKKNDYIQSQDRKQRRFEFDREYSRQDWNTMEKWSARERMICFLLTGEYRHLPESVRAKIYEEDPSLPRNLPESILDPIDFPKERLREIATLFGVLPNTLSQQWVRIREKLKPMDRFVQV